GRRVPARGGEGAEMRLLCRFLVEMKRLRVELACKALDLVGGEGVAAQLGLGADLDVLEPDHCAAAFCGSRTPISSVLVWSMTGTPLGSRNCARMRTMPISGRLFEGRLSRISTYSISGTSGRTGFSHFVSS